MEERKLTKKERITKIRDRKGALFLFLFFGSINLFGGIVYTIYDINSVGTNLRTHQPTVMTAGVFFIWFIGCYISAYYTYQALKKLKKDEK